ncbi:hypothetical protein E2C01_058796 [Portunus trituberculatus]|uniref:Uncharacterized protein n=1 Tax=Portunus trituberculatus TaxID=210409 RepID=A0A5B7H454_PORTR|nr:hypothetical protein [Portunus trituberculatus]
MPKAPGCCIPLMIRSETSPRVAWEPVCPVRGNRDLWWGMVPSGCGHLYPARDRRGRGQPRGYEDG